MNSKITYITYQNFPANTANSIQTMTHIRYFSKLNLDTTLIFPLRNKDSDDDLKVLKNFYNINENFKTKGTIHPLPFKKFLVLEKLSYIISHFLWSYFVTNKYSKNKNQFFFTRSEWVFYFLSKKNCRVIFECHQLTSLKRKLIPKALKHEHSRLILLNTSMLEDLHLKENNKIKVIPSSYDEDLFSAISNTRTKKIVYAGSLFRFGKSRGLEKLSEAFRQLKNDGIEILLALNDPDELKKLHMLKTDNMTIHSHLNRKEVSTLFKECSVGILINNKSEHSEKFTSPLKYFEYIGSGLNVVASKNEAHLKLPFQDMIFYFDLDNPDSFLNSVNMALEHTTTTPINLDEFSMRSRVEKIINLYS